MNQTSFVSIDWGGTSYKGLILKANSLVPIKIEGPSKNIRQCNDSELKDYCQKLLVNVKKITESSKLEIYAGVAGGGSLIALNRLSSFFGEDANVARVELIPDCNANLHAAFPDENGILSISGTGSILAYKVDDKIGILGGHGYLIDKTPSGAAFGKEIVSAILNFLDGDNSFKDVYAFVNSQNKHEYIKTRDALLEKLYNTNSPQAFLASFSPCLTKLAEAGNSWAYKCIEESCENLIKQIQVVIYSHSASANPISSLSMAGGVWENAPPFRDCLKKIISNKLPELKIVPPQFSNLIGPIIAGLQDKQQIVELFKKASAEI